MMTHLDHDDEIELLPVPDVDAVMFRLDVDLACDGDRFTRGQRIHPELRPSRLWGRADLLVDPDGTVRYA